MSRSSNKSSGLFSKEVFGMALVLFSVLAFLCLVIGDSIYPVGPNVRGFMLGVFGYYSFVFLILTALLGMAMVMDRPMFSASTRSFIGTLNILIFVIFAVVHIMLCMKGEMTLTDRLNDTFGGGLLNLENSTPGGAVYSLISYPLLKFLRPFGSYAVLAFVGVLCVAHFVNSYFGGKDKKPNKDKSNKNAKSLKTQPTATQSVGFNEQSTQNVVQGGVTVGVQKSGLSNNDQFDDGATIPQKTPLFIYGENPIPQSKGKGKKKGSEPYQPHNVNFPLGASVSKEELLTTKSYLSQYEQDFQEKLEYIKKPSQPNLENFGQSPMSTLNTNAEIRTSHFSQSTPYGEGIKRDVYNVENSPNVDRNIGGGQSFGGETIGDLINKQSMNPGANSSIFDRHKPLYENDEQSQDVVINRDPFSSASHMQKPLPTGNDRFLAVDFQGKNELLNEKGIGGNSDDLYNSEGTISKVEQPIVTRDELRETAVQKPIIPNTSSNKFSNDNLVQGTNSGLDLSSERESFSQEDSLRRETFFDNQTAKVKEEKVERRIEERVDISSSVVSKTPVQSKKAEISSPIYEEKSKKTEIVEVEKPNPIDNIPKNYRYRKPPFNLLKDYAKNQEEYAKVKEIQQKRAETIVSIFKSVKKIDVNIVDIIIGPTVTKFVMEIPEDVSAKSILMAQEDLQLRLAASAAINIGPIAGTTFMGIEVPNEKTSMVGLRSVLTDKRSVIENNDITFAYGQDILGNPINLSINQMPHLIVAGTTGTGKSVCLNSMLISLFYRYSPEQLRLIIVDPKKVEFVRYKNIPHLMFNEIIYDDVKAAAMLEWAVMEMDRRYDVFKDINVVNYNEYCKYMDSQGTDDKKFPYIIVLIDEFNDLLNMNQNNRKSLENSICRLAQKARAAGMSVILATQRPSADVINGTIKTNFPARICFKTSNNTDSTIVIGSTGAEKLLGKGDSYYKMDTMPNMERAQCAFISNDEVKDVIEYICTNNKAYYDEKALEIINKVKETTNNVEKNTEDDGKVDEVYLRALRAVIMSGNASKASIQAKLSIGYPKVMRIIEWMVENGYISDLIDSKNRTIYITREIYEEKYGPFVESWK